MYMSRVRLQRERISFGRLSRLAAGDSYAAHQLLWRLFSSGEGEDRNKARPFLYRQIAEGEAPTFYLLSQEKPQDRDDIWQLDVKDFAPKLQAGMPLQFDLRLNPVKRSRLENGKQVRHDLIMDKKQGLRGQNVEIDMPALEREAAIEWLASRAENNGFSLAEESITADSYRQHRFRPGRKPAAIRFSSLDVRGLLQVADVDRFRQTLFSGLGPAKSFGCGLLLVRPA